MQRPAAAQEQKTEIPQPITGSVVLPPPKPAAPLETYSVVVTNVPAHEILFALARDAKINLDIHPGIGGTVTINAVNQTLPQILTRIARQVDMRYELDNGTLTVMPDSPFLRNYKIDYVNMERDSDGAISNATQVGSNASGSATGSISSNNNSSLTIKNTSKNHFWGSLIQNIKDILHETDKTFPTSGGASQAATKEASSAPPTPTFREAASVIANQENGVITVRATGKQHEKVQQFIDQVMSSARRQVLIEATVVEVRLSNEYQQGINWSALRLGGTGFQLSQAASAGLASTNTGKIFTLDYANPLSSLGNLAAQVSLLESFGNVKVLSSPKLSVMNNQTAMLRVVDNLVYFVMSATTTAPTGTSGAYTAFTTTPNTVPIGFTMSVTPQISDGDTVLLNMRPSISRLLGYVNDPNPELAKADVVSRIPQTQTREMESVLKIENNQIAVMGGLMQDSVNKLTDEVPLLGRIPLLGNLFRQRNDQTEKTELVIFLRPVVIKNSDINGDFSQFRSSLPDENFLNESASGKN
jgi:general secretion pathway protein D